MRKEKLLGLTEVIFSVVAIIAVCLFVAWKLQLIMGFPKGVDAYAHLAKVVWIGKNFPHISWNPYWDSGTYFWRWTYPPLGSLATALLSFVTGFPATRAMTWVSFASMTLLAVSIFFTIRFWTKTTIALPIVILAITTPALWSWWGHGGNYIRLWGIGWYGFSFYLFIRYLHDPTKRRYILLVLALGLSMSSHMLFGGLTIVTIGLYTLFAVRGWLKKIIVLVKTLGVGLLLSGYFYIPILISTNGNRFIEPALGSAIPWKDLIVINPQYPYFSLPAILSIPGVVVLVSALVFFIRRVRLPRLTWAVIPVFSLATIGTLIYMLIGHIPGYPENGYLAVFAPFAMLPLLIIYSGFLMAIVLYIISFRLPKKIFQGSLVSISTVIIAIAVSRNVSSWTVYDVHARDARQSVTQSLVEKIPLDPLYRFGTDSAFVADWFSYKYPDLPQTRDYIYQGIPYKQWQYFQEYVLWTQADRYLESQWLLDWYGVKFFTVGFASSRTQYDKFASRPDLFRVAGALPDQNFFVYEYTHPKPIVSISDAPPILIVSSQTDYDIVVRTFAIAGWGTDSAIPIFSKDIQGIGTLDVQRFPTVFLYRYPLRDEEWEILKTYVEGGGRLVIESPEPKGQQNFPSWFPVTTLVVQGISDNWKFTNQQGEAVDVRDSLFGPAAFGTSSWNVVSGQPKDSARVLLRTKNYPIIISDEIGRGTIVWSGLNLPYHAESNRNVFEASFFGKLLGIPSAKTVFPVIYQVNQPEYRQWVIQEKAAGLVWKETYFPHHWNVLWTDQRGKQGNAPLLLAGPNLMYIPLPVDATYPLTITARYHLDFADWTGWISTFGTLLGIVWYAVFGVPKVFSHSLIFLSGKKGVVSSSIGHWWEAEE